MTRLLFCGDSAGTGFGTVTRELGKGLLALGLDVRFVSMNEQPGGELEEPFVGRTAIVGGMDGWIATPTDEETAKATTARLEGMFTGGLFEDGWKPDAAIILGDPASMKMSPVPAFVPDGFPAFHYVPIEGVGLPPAWRAIWERFTPVAITESGADAIAAVTGKRPPVIYHGVDTETFHPVSAATPIVATTPDGIIHKLRSRADCRRILGWPEDDVILFRHDRHMPRKNYASLFRIAAQVIARQPKTRLMVHCYTMDQGGDLSDEWSKYPPPIADRIRSTGYHDARKVVTPKFLSIMLNAADIFVSTSAEGFGLCIAEALACGIPAVGLDYSSVPEVIGPAGVTVPSLLIDNVYSYFWARPNEPEYVRALERLVADPRERELLGVKGPRHVREHFQWPHCAEQWGALIEAAVRQEVAA